MNIFVLDLDPKKAAEYHCDKHASFEGYAHYLKQHPSCLIGSMTPFVQAMPEQYRTSDPVEAYRNFYVGEKARFATWRAPSTIPTWFMEKYHAR